MIFTKIIRGFISAWPVYRNHLRYPDVNPPLVAVSMLMLMYVYISINEG